MKKGLRKLTTSMVAVAFAFSMCEPAQIKADNMITQTPAETTKSQVRKEFSHTCYDSNGEAVLEYSMKPTFSFNGESVSIVNSPSALVIYDYDKVFEAVTQKDPDGGGISSITYRVGYQYSDTERHYESITYSCDKFGNLKENWISEH